ncbi:hypothetical protein P153DRAFT_371857 [Dothidotthia symphoricarpi CBS 119687]|uniref:EGF-like domain-containing protein n=1 Tax=Dothidotthia symphoricarpi CBS 119687 TaxID=1392245 RepID=A0A6A6AU29_9PLEO|nr:uncharacterized protein P153DRAFT_371857 [Dothidotthia symphoricarpi CBS 119687]KAF2134465.1 hypothetical protein P153DRAFT_371857 [Dothidotthia symphoricarpi CBS 119687]
MRLKSYILPFTLLTSIGAAQPCSTDEDCSLNGLCTPTPSSNNNQTATCICDPGWIGPDCGRLDLAPATRWTGYNHTNFTSPTHYGTRGNSSWGGQILQDRTDPTLFHLIADQFAGGCGLSGWRPASFVVRAESRNGPQGPYEWAQNVTGSFRHNAYAFWSEADEKYLLWGIGVDIPDPTSCKGVDKKSWPNNISVSAAPDMNGPWTPFQVLVNGTNPAPFPAYSPEMPTSEIVLAAEDLKIYVANTWNGNYELINTAPWNTTDYSPTWTEDPFIWRDKRGHWHALAHWMIDIAEKGVKYPRVGAHMYSRTLEGKWNFKVNEAYNSTVMFTDGSVETFNRRERPKLYFSDDGEMTPLYMINGVQPLGTTVLSYTLIQPIGTAWKGYEEALGF